jgi:hypothetical protein
MISTLTDGTDWYRNVNYLPIETRQWERELGGVEDGYNGYNYQAYRTGTASNALVVDARGPAARFRGFMVFFYLDHERGALLKNLRAFLRPSD